MACLSAACDSPPPDITPQREHDRYDKTSTEPAAAWVCRWWGRGVGGLPLLLLWWHLLLAVSSHWSFEMALMWCFVLRYKFAARVLLLVRDWCGHCPDPSLSHPVRLYRDRITTVPARSPQSEHAKADSGISFSESLEKPNVRLSRKTTLKRHRAPNGKNNSANKRVRRHPVWLHQWKPVQHMIIYSYMYCRLYHLPLYKCSDLCLCQCLCLCLICSAASYFNMKSDLCHL